MVVRFDFAARFILDGLKAPLDWPRPDDSILLLIYVPACFDNEVVRGALEHLAGQSWS